MKHAISHADRDEPEAGKSVPRDSVVFYVALAVLYALILAVKFNLWHANALQADWTYYNNVFWNTNFRDLWLFSYDRFNTHGYPSYLNEHFAPLLIALAALYQHVPYPEAFLLVLHGASPIVTAILIRAIGLRVLDDRKLATAIALVFAFNPGILWPTVSLVYGFEPDSLLPLCAALAVYGLATRRDALYVVGLLIGCGIKENVPAYGVIFGLCLILFTGRKRLGLWSAGLSLVIFLIASKGVPMITGRPNGNIGVVWILLDDLKHFRLHLDYTWPEIAFAAVYCAFFIPALFVLPFLAVIGPDLLAIGQVIWATTGTWHIMLPVTVLGIASVFGTARVLRVTLRGARLIRLYWRACLLASLIAGPATLWLAHARYVAQAVPIDRAALAQAIKLIPPDAGLAATNDLDQYFAHRKVLTTLPRLLRKTPSDFAYLAVNRRALIAARLEGKALGGYERDSCLIKIAETVAADTSAVVLNQGDLLVVKLNGLPQVACE